MLYVTTTWISFFAKKNSNQIFNLAFLRLLSFIGSLGDDLQNCHIFKKAHKKEHFFNKYVSDSL